MVSASGVMLSAGLFLGMLACLELGYRLGHRANAGHGDSHDGLGTIEAAIFALLGLLLGFAFAGAMSRLDARRALIVQEANAIGTAYLRLDLLPSDDPALRHLFREYLEARTRANDRPDDSDTAHPPNERATQLQRQIWTRAVALSKNDSTQNTARVILPALNEMIDVTTARAVAGRISLPTPILTLLMLIALLSSVVAGYAMAARGRRGLLHALWYAAAIALTVYIVLDLDNPRVGLIRLEATERILQALHDSIR